MPKTAWQPRFEAPWRDDPWDDPDVIDAVVLERPRRHRRHLRYVVWAAIAVVLALVLQQGLRGLAYVRDVNPDGDPSDKVTFTVQPDDSLQSIAERLYEQGFVTDSDVFVDYVTDHGGLTIVPGYYELRRNDHVGNLQAALSTPPGLTFTKVTFPEGFTIDKMANRLNEKLPRIAAADFVEAATDGSVTSDLLPPGVTSLEGLLFPDTYEVSNAETPRQMLQRMVGLTERVGRQEGLYDAQRAVGLTPYEVLIVASIIEREAKVDADRARIARVIYNRLYLGMPLQVDATLYYGQDPETPFSVLKALDTPYNTYLYSGLPPTPIANPGRASIEAALNPAPNPGIGDPLCASLAAGEPCIYLFYVLIDEDGSHAFAVTLEQHEANIQRARDAGVL